MHIYLKMFLTPIIIALLLTGCANNEDEVTVETEETLFQTAKMLATDANTYDYFGSSVAISGDYIVVGAYKEDTTATKAGAVYLFKKLGDGSLKNVTKLQAKDTDGFEYFGNSVAIDGDYIVIGAENQSSHGYSSTGAAYVFKINSDSNVSQIAKIYASDPYINDMFGCSVSISGEYVVVGAERKNTLHYDDEGYDNLTVYSEGAAYLFKIHSDTNVSQIAKLEASDAKGADYFGSSVAIDNDYIVIGAQTEYWSESDIGSAYIFKINSDNNISEIAKLQASDAKQYDHFGNSVSIDGNYIAVGAYGEYFHTSDPGAAYIFEINSDTNISQIVKLQLSNAKEYDFFGNSVSINGDYIVVGATKADSTVSDSGVAYLYKKDSNNSIVQITKIESSDSDVGDYFGSSVSIDGNSIVVGAALKDSTAYMAGSAYLFDIEPQEQIYLYNTPQNTIVYNEARTQSIFEFEAVTPTFSAISYSLSGDDADKFALVNNNLTYISSPDFELPEDSDIDNNYSVTVNMSSSNGKTKSVDVNISVQDRYYQELALLKAYDSDEINKFGNSVAIDSDYFAVVASEPTRDKSAGNVYVYKKNSDDSIENLSKISFDDINETITLVAIDGDYISMSSYQNLYLYKINSANSSLIQIAETTAPDGYDFYYSSLSMSGDYIIISSNGSYERSAFLYKKALDDSSITLVKKIEMDDTNDTRYENRTDSSVSIDGNYIAIGVRGEDNTTAEGGSAYIFKIDSNDSVTKVAKIKANDAKTYDSFGSSVSISGDYIVVGAGNDWLSKDTTPGSAYLFKKATDNSSVTQVAKLQASDAKVFDDFGCSASISNNNIVIGASRADSKESSTGAAYVFRINSDTNVTQVEKIHASQATHRYNFGRSVSISGDHILVGETKVDSFFGQGTMFGTGVAYLYKKDPNQSE